MKISKFELISYAEAFVSFVLPKMQEIQEIILFGSVSRDEHDNNSDIDLFFNIQKKQDERKIKEALEIELGKFLKSRLAERFHLAGIKNEIKPHIGILDEWKLKRSIISEGIVLYGKYKEVPEKLKAYSYFNILPIKNIAKRNKLIRILFGRKEKQYSSEGILKKLSAKKLSPSSFIVPIESQGEIIKILGNNKINCTFFEFWTDQFPK